MINDYLREGKSDVDIIFNHLGKAWKQKCKTGSFYMRVMAAQKPGDFGKIREEEDEDDKTQDNTNFSGDVKSLNLKTTVSYTCSQDCVACAS